MTIDAITEQQRKAAIMSVASETGCSLEDASRAVGENMGLIIVDKNELERIKREQEAKAEAAKAIQEMLGKTLLGCTSACLLNADKDHDFASKNSGFSNIVAGFLSGDKSRV